MMTSHFKLANQQQISYCHTPGESPGVIYFCGFNSDKESNKALAVEQCCQEWGHAFLRFDYRGLGESSGDFKNFTISDWFKDACTVMEHLTEGPQIIVGSSMGGWIAALVAKAMPQRIHAIITLAAAPDFTTRVTSELSQQQQKELEKNGIVYIPCDFQADETFPITQKLIDDGNQNCLVLNQSIPFNGPIRMIHSLRDGDVPWKSSLQLAECFTSEDIHIELIKDGDHRLSRDEDLLLLKQKLFELIASKGIKT